MRTRANPLLAAGDLGVEPSTRRRFIGGAAALGLGGGLLAACGSGGASAEAEVAQSVFLASGLDLSSGLSRAIVDEYESWDAQRLYDDRVRVHKVSKVFEGRYRIDSTRTEECPDGAKTLMQAAVFELEVVRTSCDSAVSQSDLDGGIEGELVIAYAGAETSSRGTLTGRLKWGGFGSNLVGTLAGVENAGSHGFPIGSDEACDETDHFEGWIRASIFEGNNSGCPLLASIAYDLDRGFDGSSGEMKGSIEGVLICECAS